MNKFIFLLFLVSSVFAEPNILLITTDDQRYDSVDDFMPTVRDEIMNKGIRFNRGYVTTPQCCPSRSSILTGLYTKNHKVYGNRSKLKNPTIFNVLQEKYYQGLVGKYLNSWSGMKRPEFDYWVSFHRGNVDYNNPRLNVNGLWTKKNGYITEIFTSYAQDFLDKASQQDKPFFLMLNFNAPHDPAVPAPADFGKFENYPVVFPANYNKFYPGQSDWLKKRDRISKKQKKQIEFLTKRRWESLASVDRGIKLILDQLKAQNKLEDTLIFYLSDNGMLIGEHKIIAKDSPYEGAVRVPFAVRYDTLIKTPRTSPALVANIDIVPTIYDILGYEFVNDCDGVSLQALFSQEQDVHDRLFLEGYRSSVNRDFRALIQMPYKLIMFPPFRNPDNLELYDLNMDPLESKNLARSLEFKVKTEELKNQITDFYK